MKGITFSFAVLIISIFLLASQSPPESVQNPKRRLKALIIDGQSNHGIWPKTTAMMKD